MKEYLKLIRVKHWLKNILIFLPLFFSKRLLNTELLIKKGINTTLFDGNKDLDLDDNVKSDKGLNIALIIVGVICVSIIIIGLAFILIASGDKKKNVTVPKELEGLNKEKYILIQEISELEKVYIFLLSFCIYFAIRSTLRSTKKELLTSSAKEGKTWQLFTPTKKTEKLFL